MYQRGLPQLGDVDARVVGEHVFGELAACVQTARASGRPAVTTP